MQMETMSRLRGLWAVTLLGACACGTSCGRPEAAATEADAAAQKSRIPHRRTSVEALADAELRHQEVARIEQSLHPDEDYQIAIDAWISSEPGNQLAEVRMWWVDTGKNDERSPFGRGVRRHIDIDYERRDAHAFVVRMAEKEQVYLLDVELGADGTAAAYATVTPSSGAAIEHCRVTGGRLVTKTMIGIPVGLERLEVACIDAAGQAQQGEVRPVPR